MEMSFQRNIFAIITPYGGNNFVITTSYVRGVVPESPDTKWALTYGVYMDK